MDQTSIVDEFPRIMLNFQFIEEGLRQYMLRAHVMIASEVGSFITYSPSDWVIANAALGRLISLFARLNSNHALHAQLRHLLPKRNFFAHQAYVTLGYGAAPPKDLAFDADALEKVRNESNTCVQLIWEEVKQLEARFVAHRDRGI